MLPAAFAFSGGVYVKDAISKANLPRFRSASDGTASFRLSVRIVSASVPALVKPGLLSQRRPRLEVTLGDVQKDTELADYVADDESSPEAGACARECPWRFGDTLTFVASLKDVSGPGLRFRLRAHSDIFLGPVQLQLQRVADLGEGSYDIRQRILPACVRDRSSFNGSDTWESPMLPIPFSHVKGGLCSDDHGLGEAVAHVTVVFKLDMDPDMLMEMADEQVRPVSAAINKRAESVMRWAFEQPVSVNSGRDGWASDGEGDECQDAWEPKCDAADLATAGLCSFCVDHGGGEAVEVDELDFMQQTLTGAEIQRAIASARCHPSQGTSMRTISAPDSAPEGWISRRGPNGRLYWHHRSLGPAPWEEEPTAAPDMRCRLPQRSRLLENIGPIVSPNLPDDCWVSRIGPGGRLFWHNRSLGPAPWEVAPHVAVRHPQFTTI